MSFTLIWISFTDSDVTPALRSIEASMGAHPKLDFSSVGIYNNSLNNFAGKAINFGCGFKLTWYGLIPIQRVAVLIKHELQPAPIYSKPFAK